ncbi:MAG TPA: hypothetical protein VFJ58_13030, partial [Armatimonadota bacterium]|nr:hypothetical protein [Armatimonadota bacterium]
MNRVALGLFVLFTVALAGCGGDTPFNPKTGSIPTTTATAITSINFTANSVQGGQPITGTIVLNGVAGTGGAVVNLTSNSTSAVVPASFTIPAGQSSGTFQVTTSAVTANTPVVITSNFNGSSQTFTLTLTPGPVSGTPSVSTITFALAGGIGGQTATGTITLNSAAPAGGTVV